VSVPKQFPTFSLIPNPCVSFWSFISINFRNIFCAQRHYASLNNLLLDIYVIINKEWNIWGIIIILSSALCWLNFIRQPVGPPEFWTCDSHKYLSRNVEIWLAKTANFVYHSNQLSEVSSIKVEAYLCSNPKAKFI
jgi:hypothetical protein